MPRWLPKVLRRIREFAAAGAVRLTYKATREAVGLGFAPEDVRDVIGTLSAGDSAGRLVSETTGEWMYVFKPTGRRTGPLREDRPSGGLRRRVVA